MTKHPSHLLAQSSDFSAMNEGSGTGLDGLTPLALSAMGPGTFPKELRGVTGTLVCLCSESPEYVRVVDKLGFIKKLF